MCFFPFLFLFFFKTGFLYSPGHRGTLSVDQASLELPASVSRALGLKARATTVHQYVVSFIPEQSRKSRIENQILILRDYNLPEIVLKGLRFHYLRNSSIPPYLSSMGTEVKLQILSCPWQ